MNAVVTGESIFTFAVFIYILYRYKKIISFEFDYTTAPIGLKWCIPSIKKNEISFSSNFVF